MNFKKYQIVIFIFTIFNISNLFADSQLWKFYTKDSSNYPNIEGIDRILLSPKDSISLLTPGYPVLSYTLNNNKWSELWQINYGNNHYNFSDICYDKDTTYYLSKYNVIKTYYNRHSRTKSQSS